MTAVPPKRPKPLLEQNTVDLLHDLGAGERLAREGLKHNGINLRCQGRTQYARSRSSRVAT